MRFWTQSNTTSILRNEADASASCSLLELSAAMENMWQAEHVLHFRRPNTALRTSGLVLDGKDVMIALSEVEEGYDFCTSALAAFFLLTAKLLEGIGRI